MIAMNNQRSGKTACVRPDPYGLELGKSAPWRSVLLLARCRKDPRCKSASAPPRRKTDDVGYIEKAPGRARHGKTLASGTEVLTPNPCPVRCKEYEQKSSDVLSAMTLVMAAWAHSQIFGQGRGFRSQVVLKKTAKRAGLASSEKRLGKNVPIRRPLVAFRALLSQRSSAKGLLWGPNCMICALVWMCEYALKGADWL